MSDTIFDKIVAGTLPAYKVWEDEHYLAFLTPFPNTPGVTVVIPKSNPGDYIFALEHQDYSGLLHAAQLVARLLEKALATPRVAMVVEGTGVPYVHVKLYPLHGQLAAATGQGWSHQEFYPQYVGHLSTAEGPRMADEELVRIQAKIVAAKSDKA